MQLHLENNGWERGERGIWERERGEREGEAEAEGEREATGMREREASGTERVPRERKKFVLAFVRCIPFIFICFRIPLNIHIYIYLYILSNTPK